MPLRSSPSRVALVSITSALALNLAGCGGGSHGSSDVTATDAQVIADVTSSNIQASYGAGFNLNATWRWQGTPQPTVTVYIPPPSSTDANQQTYASEAQTTVATINRKLAGLLVLQAVTTQPTSGNYIEVSYGTAYVPPGSTDYASYCSNVSTAPYSGTPIYPDANANIAPVPVYVNLGNGHCDVTQDIVTHEFGHALALSNHFNGFGYGPSISTAFWDVLATLYGNPPLTAASNLKVVRAAP